ncbi:MAG: siphovirus Gp157 family protein [Rickettsiales bacterium TMED289]|nr:MAG: siphovirus Gp157 family protein [Rickettsiales bacterium TMED289]|tara:strand:- start:1135 stop:1626 length:492 start_codon:yes stop_codon:yes gene_type:complete
MSKTSLYNIANEFEKSLDSLLDHDDSDLINQIELIEGEFKSKSANVARYIRNLEHLASGIKEVESNQRKRRAALEKKIERLKEYLRINFEKTNTDKIESEDIIIAIYKNPEKVNVINEELIPDQYFILKENKVLDKDKIKESLKNGDKIPGCELIQEKRINIK